MKATKTVPFHGGISIKINEVVSSNKQQPEIQEDIKQVLGSTGSGTPKEISGSFDINDTTKTTTTDLNKCSNSTLIDINGNQHNVANAGAVLVAADAAIVAKLAANDNDDSHDDAPKHVSQPEKPDEYLKSIEIIRGIGMENLQRHNQLGKYNSVSLIVNEVAAKESQPFPFGNGIFTNEQQTTIIECNVGEDEQQQANKQVNAHDILSVAGLRPTSMLGKESSSNNTATIMASHNGQYHNGVSELMRAAGELAPLEERAIGAVTDKSKLQQSVSSNAKLETDTHVVKIQIKPTENSTSTSNDLNQTSSFIVHNQFPHTVDCVGAATITEKQVTVVKLNEQKIEIPQSDKEVASIFNKKPQEKVLENISNLNITSNCVVPKSELRLNLTEMVQKVQQDLNIPSSSASKNMNSSISNSNFSLTNKHEESTYVPHKTLSLQTPNFQLKSNSEVNTSSCSGNNSITELNVNSHQTTPYMYYSMSSGQFSPCDTLDSGTGSDLESNGQQTPAICITKTNKFSENIRSATAPILELHMKSTKLRLQTESNNDHIRASSLTDEGEESEESCNSSCSLSSDSLHNLSSNNINQKPTAAKLLSSALLPDSLLRDIRHRKFSAQEFPIEESPIEPLESEQTNSHIFKRSSIPPSKTFILNVENGTFVDTKMNSMPRTYEADKYYNFHINEHANFRSFGNGCSSLTDASPEDECNSLNTDRNCFYGSQSLQDDAFAGYKDIRCSSATSTIRSSKGTVRGVKNRVRNGIATFLQLQQPNVKNYKDKDQGKVVLYTTSMGIIRDTYAKCANLKQILRTLLVKFEERDVFMSVEYQAEIRERMHSDIIRVPQLFVEGQHIGDADAVERLNETGELRQLLKPYKSIATIRTCQTCGGYRLLPCPSCNGSKKSVHRNHFTAEFVALKCMNCDEVGLVKCHNC